MRELCKIGDFWNITDMNESNYDADGLFNFQVEIFLPFFRIKKTTKLQKLRLCSVSNRSVLFYRLRPSAIKLTEPEIQILVCPKDLIDKSWANTFWNFWIPRTKLVWLRSFIRRPSRNMSLTVSGVWWNRAGASVGIRFCNGKGCCSFSRKLSVNLEGQRLSKT